MKKIRTGLMSGMMLAMFSATILFLGAENVQAKQQEETVAGRVYFFEENEHYDYVNAETFEKTSTDNTYGIFTISGDIVEKSELDGVASYMVSGDAVSLKYEYTDALLNADEEEWHLTEDNSKTIADIKLDHEIDNGTVILQTSKDGITWLNDVELTNVFEDVPVQNEAFYKANDVQLSNGCYYRVIIAYETRKKVGQDEILFIKNDKNEYKKYAEVYEFYMKNRDSEASSDAVLSKTLGTVTRTESEGYTGTKKIGINDVHYGWELGQFFVSGYTRETSDQQNRPVFLKNVGDQITLWFNLKQDISKLNDDENLTISDDDSGYDQYFQIKKTDMGHGTLIIRYTDEQGVKHDPEIYTNYLEANASTSADTIVKLFEEGDYEVALDYEIKSVPRKVAGIEIVPDYTDYRIAFEFSVRNGNCMVYPFDVNTGAELNDEAITADGFRLDMAKSKYLTIDVQRSVVTEGANGYVEDIRFNRPAKDGEEYTEEGIYTFNVKNLYTGENTTKKIYVGSSDYMNALSVNKITVDALNTQLSNGAVLKADGTLVEKTVSTSKETEQINTEEPVKEVSVEVKDQENTEITSEKHDSSKGFPVIVVLPLGVAVLVCMLMMYRAKNNKKGQEDK